MAKFSSLQFELKDLIMIGTVVSVVVGFEWNSLKKMEHIETMIAEVKVYKSADDRVVNSRLDNLEISQANNTKRQNDFEKFQFRIEAIVDNDTELRLLDHETKSNKKRNKK